MKDKLGGEMMKKFAGLRPKMYSYIKYNDKKEKKVKRAKNVLLKEKCIMEKEIKFDKYKNWK